MHDTSRRVFRRHFTRNGKRKPIGKFYGEYRSLNGGIRRIPLCKRYNDSLAALDALILSVRRLSNRNEQKYPDPPDAVRKAFEFEKKIAASLHCKAPASDIASLIEQWKNSLIARNLTEKHVRTTVNRAEQIITSCGITQIAHVEAAAVEQELRRLRERGTSVQTCNHYLQACKQFTRWMNDNELTEKNPLARLRGLNVTANRKHERRALRDDELKRLIESTKKEPQRYRMTGTERALLYRTACETGLRANELRHVAPKDCQLTTNHPTIEIPAQRSKRRRTERQPITQSLAAAIQEHTTTTDKITDNWNG